MNKYILKLFGFLKSFVQFIKIIIVLCALLLLFYWVQNLIGTDWGWLNFSKPLSKIVLSACASISDEALDVFGVMFEYKYLWALVIYAVLFFGCDFLTLLLEKAEDLYDDSRRIVKKINENNFNTKLENNQVIEQKYIQKYNVYIKTSIKKKFDHKELHFDIDEQNRIMNKFLIEKTGISPVRYKEGFLYSFKYFEDIDKTIELLFKLINSTAPLDYTICIQIIDNKTMQWEQKLEKLISLNKLNKILIMSDTAYRYKFNKFHRYGTSQQGVYKGGTNTYEVHEFIEI